MPTAPAPNGRPARRPAGAEALPDELRPLLLATGLALALVLGAFAGQGALLVAVVAAQALLAYGLCAVLDVPSRVPGAAIAAAAGVAGCVAVAVRDDDEPSLGPLAAVLALTAVAAIVHQLARTDGRRRITASLTATLGAAGLAVPAAALVAQRAAEEGRAVTVVVALAAGGAAVAASVPLPAARFEPTVFGSGFVQGLAGGLLVGNLEPLDAAAIAAAAAGLAVAGRRAAEYLLKDSGPEVAPPRAGKVAGPAAPAARRSGGAAALSAALPVVLAAPAAYVLGRVLVA